MSAAPPDLSVVIPARDESVAMPGLIEGIEAALAGRAFEIIVVDDGSTDAMPQVLDALRPERPHLRVLRHARPFGQSGAVRSGVRAARAALVVTLDGDGQNPPDQIPRLLAPFGAPGAEALGLVQGQRTDRRDSVARRLASRIANAVRAGLLGDGVRDSACGLKAFRRAAYLDLPYFDHIHRFMPALMLRAGWRVVTVDVTHRPRAGGRSKYTNLGRALVGVPDLVGVAWLIRRAGPVLAPEGGDSLREITSPAPPDAVGARGADVAGAGGAPRTLRRRG